MNYNSSVSPSVHSKVSAYPNKTPKNPSSSRDPSGQQLFDAPGIRVNPITVRRNAAGEYSITQKGPSADPSWNKSMVANSFSGQEDFLPLPSEYSADPDGSSMSMSFLQKTPEADTAPTSKVIQSGPTRLSGKISSWLISREDIQKVITIVQEMQGKSRKIPGEGLPRAQVFKQIISYLHKKLDTGEEQVELSQTVIANEMRQNNPHNTYDFHSHAREGHKVGNVILAIRNEFDYQNPPESSVRYRQKMDINKEYLRQWVADQKRKGKEVIITFYSSITEKILLDPEVLENLKNADDKIECLLKS